MHAVDLILPTDEQAVRALRVGDFVHLHGVLYTGRDAVHKHLAEGGRSPCDFRGTVIYHCGPVVVPRGSGWRVTAAGPTTSIREEPYMARLIGSLGLRGIIGKGGMGPGTLAACREHGCVYLHAIGGAAQVLAEAIRRVNGVYFLEEFGTPEAIWELAVEGFPALVTMDAHGASLHGTISRHSQARLAELLAAPCKAPMQDA